MSITNAEAEYPETCCRFGRLMGSSVPAVCQLLSYGIAVYRHVGGVERECYGI